VSVTTLARWGNPALSYGDTSCVGDAASTSWIRELANIRTHGKTAHSVQSRFEMASPLPPAAASLSHHERQLARIQNDVADVRFWLRTVVLQGLRSNPASGRRSEFGWRESRMQLN
jgi:hypothetical protein